MLLSRSIVFILVILFQYGYSFQFQIFDCQLWSNNLKTNICHNSNRVKPLFWNPGNKSKKRQAHQSQNIDIVTSGIKSPNTSSFVNKLIIFFKENWLVLGEILVILVAKQNPRLGASGGILRPEITISKIGVFAIFFINGVAISLSPGTEDNAAVTTQTNMLIQLFSFGLIPLLAKIFAPYYPVPSFRDGFLVLSCLPITINICVAQTLSAGANMATAIFNAIFANVVGVFLTPLLSVWLLGTDKGVSLLSTLYKLGNVVILPLVLGQIVKRSPIGSFFQRISAYSRTLSSFLLLAIVYNIFSDTFLSGIGVGGSALVMLLVSMPILYLGLSLMFWHLSKFLLPGLDPSTRAAALFCAPQKTLAFGIPFIKTAFGTRPDLAYVMAPLLMYAPTQLLLGSVILVPLMRYKISQGDTYIQGSGI